MKRSLLFGALLVTALMLLGPLAGADLVSQETTPEAGTKVSDGNELVNAGAGGDVAAARPAQADFPMVRSANGKDLVSQAQDMLASMVGPSAGGTSTGSRANDDPGNDQPSGATELFPGAVRMNQTVDGPASSGANPVDIDWYKIYLNYTKTQAEHLVITINRTSDGMVAGLFYEPFLGQFQDFEWMGCPTNDNITTIDVVSHISGYYFLQMSPMNQSTVVHYNIESVAVTSVTPTDSDSFFADGGAISTGSLPTGKKVTQNSDMFDYYNASGLITTTNPGEGEFTNITLRTDITSQISGAIHPDPTFTQSAVNVFAWTWGYILHDDAEGNLWISSTNFFAHGGSDGVSVGGTASEPFDIWADCNGSLAYIGFTTFCFIILGNQLVYGELDAWADYSVTSLTATPFIPNDAPYLLGGALDRASGYKTDEFSFNVTYFDPDDDDASQVKLVVDTGAASKQFYMELDTATSDGDNTNGENYKLALTGEELGDGSHTYHFECSDGEDQGRFPAITGELGPFSVSFNTAPTVLDDTVEIVMDEDQPAKYLAIADLFADAETPSGILAYVTYPGTTSWKTSLDTSTMTIEVLNYNANNGNRTIRFSPKENLHGQFDILVRAYDNQAYSGNVTLNITLREVNDDPVIETVNLAQPAGGAISLTADEDQWLNVSAVASDVDGDTVTFGTNATDALALKDGESYMADAAFGTFSFLFDNDMVGVHHISLMASDGRGGTDAVDMTVTVRNTNDAPVMDGVEDMDVDQDDWLNFTVVATDVDWADSGETLSLSSDIEDASDDLFETGENFFIEEGSMVRDGNGWTKEFEVSMHPDNSMVGEYEVTFTLRDKKGARDEVTMELTVDDVNDPPYLEEMDRDVYISMEEEKKDGKVYLNEELTFSARALDPDLLVEDSDEVLTYSWDFGDGSDDSGVDLKSVTHAYEEDGVTVYVNLTVTDRAGATAFASLMVEVRIDPKQDLDEDGMPDRWELDYGLDRFDPADKDSDLDGDTVSNLQEYLDRTDPTLATSYNPASAGGGGGDGASGGGDKESDSEDPTGLYLLLAVVLALVIVVILVLVLVMRKKKKDAQAAAQAQQQPAMYEQVPTYDQYGQPGMEGGMEGGMAGDAALMGDPSGAPAGLGAGAADTTDPSMQLPPATTDTTDLGDGSDDPLEPIEGGPGTAPAPAPGQGAAPAPDQAAAGEAAASEGAAGAAAPAGGNSCPSCGAPVQAGWFICPGCKNPLS